MPHETYRIFGRVIDLVTKGAAAAVEDYPDYPKGPYGVTLQRIWGNPSMRLQPWPQAMTKPLANSSP